MTGMCEKCRHSAVCLPSDAGAFLQSLFHAVSRRYTLDIFDIQAFETDVREAFLAEIPLECPLLPASKRDFVNTRFEPNMAATELRLVLVWPK